MTKICKICGRIFEAKSHQFRCCSIKCRKIAKAIAKKKTRLKNGDRNRTISVRCEVCGKEVIKAIRDYNRNIKRGSPFMCSMECVWEHKKTGKYLICPNCGKQIWVRLNRISENNYCSRECMMNSGLYVRRQDKHYRWRDDITSRPYYRGSNWTTIRKRIRGRDGYQCQICGKTEKDIGKRMDVHHIKPYRLFETDIEANVDSNLISLCPSCHHKEDALINE